MNHRGGRKTFPEQAIEVSVSNREILMALNHLNSLFQWKIQSPNTIATQSQRGEGTIRHKHNSLKPADRRSILFLINRAWRDLGAGIIGAATEPEQIHENFLPIFERGGFEQCLFLGGMKGERHTQQINQLKIRKPLRLLRFHLQAMSLAVTRKCLKYARTVTLPAFMKPSIRERFIVSQDAPITALQRKFFLEPKPVNTP